MASASSRDLIRLPGRVSGRWLATALITAVVILAIVAGVTFFVDPYQRFRIQASFAPHYYWLYKRQINPGLARNQPHDVLVTGTSLMENFSNREIGAALGGRALNAAMGAMSAYEAKRLIEVALAGGRPRMVVLDVSPNSFNGPIEQVFTPAPLPEHLYRTSLAGDLSYLLQMTPFLQSLDTMFGLDWFEVSRDPDRPWFWGHMYEYSSRAAVRGLAPDDLNRRHRFPVLDGQAMAASFDHNLVPLFRKHSQVTFKLVLPPISILAWADLSQRRQMERALEFRRHVVERAASMANVEVHDFQADAATITDLRNYMDMFHYSPALSRQMLLDLAAGRRRVDRDALERNNETLRQLVARADIPGYFLAPGEPVASPRS